MNQNIKYFYTVKIKILSIMYISVLSKINVVTSKYEIYKEDLESVN